MNKAKALILGIAVAIAMVPAALFAITLYPGSNFITGTGYDVNQLYATTCADIVAKFDPQRTAKGAWVYNRKDLPPIINQLFGFPNTEVLDPSKVYWVWCV